MARARGSRRTGWESIRAPGRARGASGAHRRGEAVLLLRFKISRRGCRYATHASRSAAARDRRHGHAAARRLPAPGAGAGSGPAEEGDHHHHHHDDDPAGDDHHQGAGDHDDHEAARPEVRGHRTVRSGAAACSPPTTRGTATSPTLAVDKNSANYVSAIGALGGNQKLHADFGGGGAYGIPYITVPGTQSLTPVTFTDYGDESDPGPYPIPLAAPSKVAATRHVLAVDRDHCKLYELFDASAGSGRWSAASGAVFDLTSNALRPEGGRRPMPPGCRSSPGSLATTRWRPGTSTTRCASPCRARSGPTSIRRRTGRRRRPIPTSRRWGCGCGSKASFDVSAYTGQSRVVLDALKKYGMIVADNGSNWFISGAPDTRWNDTDLEPVEDGARQRVRGRRHRRVAPQIEVQRSGARASRA